MSYYHDWNIPRLFGLPNRTLLDTGTEDFKTHKTGTVPKKLGRMGSRLAYYTRKSSGRHSAEGEYVA